MYLQLNLSYKNSFIPSSLLLNFAYCAIVKKLQEKTHKKGNKESNNRRLKINDTYKLNIVFNC